MCDVENLLKCMDMVGYAWQALENLSNKKSGILFVIKNVCKWKVWEFLDCQIYELFEFIWVYLNHLNFVYFVNYWAEPDLNNFDLNIYCRNVTETAIY